MIFGTHDISFVTIEWHPRFHIPNVPSNLSVCRDYGNLTDSWRRITGNGPSTGAVGYNCDLPQRGRGGIKEGWYR